MNDDNNKITEKTFDKNVFEKYDEEERRYQKFDKKSIIKLLLIILGAGLLLLILFILRSNPSHDESIKEEVAVDLNDNNKQDLLFNPIQTETPESVEQPVVQQSEIDSKLKEIELQRKLQAREELQKTMQSDLFAYSDNYVGQKEKEMVVKPYIDEQGNIQYSYESKNNGDIYSANIEFESAQYGGYRGWIIGKGKIIDAVLETELKSDLPSIAIASISNDVYADEGRNILLPKGTILYGEMSNNIRSHQKEIEVRWINARTPNGITINLDSPSTNELGQVGIPGKVNRHIISNSISGVLLSVLGVGASSLGVKREDRDNSIADLRTKTSDSLRQESSKHFEERIPPTISVKHGTRIKIIVTKDLNFARIF